jgi:glyceraldehyde 3-phosphate dehydrogenase
MESMKGKLDGTALRVPGAHRFDHRPQRVLKKSATVEEINAAFKKAASHQPLKGVLRYTEDPIVSSDIVTDPHSVHLRRGLTMSMGKLVKVLGWYDNEWGYSNRLIDLTLYTASKLTSRKR